MRWRRPEARAPNSRVKFCLLSDLLRVGAICALDKVRYARTGEFLRQFLPRETCVLRGAEARIVTSDNYDECKERNSAARRRYRRQDPRRTLAKFREISLETRKKIHVRSDSENTPPLEVANVPLELGVDF